MISINGLTVEFSGEALFSEISFLINKRDKIGLTGKNGAGKTTLLKVLCGLQNYNKGELAIPKDTKIGYLPQQIEVSDTQNVFEETRKAFSQILLLDKEIQQLNLSLCERSDYHSEDYLKIIDQLNEKNDLYNILGGGNMEAEIESTLLGLGFLRSDFDRATKEFSGGWRMRIELAKVILQKPDLLLLDEPTNHLDIESVQWFEDLLKTYEGAVVIVSHDQAFLDNVTQRTIEISLGKIYDYKVSYSQYVKLREEMLVQQRASYENQQKKIEQTEQFIERFRYKASKAVQVQSRIKMLEKIERIEIDDFDKSAIYLKFPPAPHSGQIVVEAKELSKSFDKHLVLDTIDFVLEKGEKVAFVGKNGEGKTTFSKIITEHYPFDGELKIGHQVKIGYYAQNQSEMLDENDTVLKTIDDVAKGDMRTKIRDILAMFLFRGDEVDKKVSVLSGGERARLSLAKLLLEPVNLLILDEPTNHLDMRSKNILKQALINYDGTLILVSHDRHFLNSIVQTVYEFKNKKIKQHKGGINDFLEKKRLESLNDLNLTKKVSAKNSEKEKTTNKLNYQERKEINRQIRKAQANIDECEESIFSIENEIEEINKLMEDPQKINDKNLFDRYSKLKKMLSTAMKEWEKKSQELEKIIKIKEQI